MRAKQQCNADNAVMPFIGSLLSNLRLAVETVYHFAMVQNRSFCPCFKLIISI
jgi:hypothetical protein